MLRYIIVFAVAATVIMACAKEDMHANHDHDNVVMSKESKMMATMDEPVIYYTCPKEEHKHIHSREAGKCSECGMEMVQGVITSEDKMEFWGCPMEAHAHVRLDEAGTCEECGMKLKPMRLKKS